MAQASKPKSKAAPAKRTFDDMIAPQPPEVQETARALRALVLEAAPGADEGIYGGAKVGISLYSLGHSNNVLCGVQPAGGKVLFYVHHVKEEDSAELKLEGKGGENRHVKFHSPDEVRREPVLALLRLARQRMKA